jgi:single-strand DNA-binding protein
MSSFNRVTIMGNLGSDPEIRRTTSGDPVASMRIATSRTWKDKDSGEKKENTQWHSVVCFNENLCTIIEKYVVKGSKILIEGELQTRKWQDRDGNDRYSTEVVMSKFGGTLQLITTPQGRSEDEYGTTRTKESSATDERGPTPAEYRDKQVTGGSNARFDDSDEIPFAPEWRA